MKRVVAQPWLFLIVLAIPVCLLLLLFGAESLGLLVIFVVLPAAPVLLLNIISMIWFWRKKGKAASAAVTGFNVGLIIVVVLSSIHIILVEINSVSWGYGLMVWGVLAVIACIGVVIGTVLSLILFSESHLLDTYNDV